METLRDEFRLQKLGFGGVPVSTFLASRCQWSLQRGLFFAYRILVALYQLSWNIAVPVVWGYPSYYRQPVDHKSKWLIYLSNWSFCMLTAYLITAAASVLVSMSQTQRRVGDVNELVTTGTEGDAIQDDRPQERIPPLPWYLKLTWLLQSITYSACVFVTFGYWLIEFKPGSTIVQIFTIHVHGINLIIVLIDVLVVATPVRLLHFVYPYFYFIVYQLFALIYYKSGGTNPYGGTHIYKGFIDWEYASDKALIILFVGTTFAAPCLHAIFFGLAKLRIAVARKCCVST